MLEVHCCSLILDWENEVCCVYFQLLVLYFYYCILGPASQDADSDEEWPALGEAGASDRDAEVVVDPDDEKAIEMFMNKNPPMRRDLAQLVEILRSVSSCDANRFFFVVVTGGP